jgi:hypothetical protein
MGIRAYVAERRVTGTMLMGIKPLPAGRATPTKNRRVLATEL